MNHTTRLPILLVLVLALVPALVLAGGASTPATALPEAERDRVLRCDVVELIDNGREVEGKVDFQAQHGRYLYLFASSANLAAFTAGPAKYQIQLGGACARMGPLSGEGSTKIFAVHQGRLYIFASEQCRQTFLAAPEKLLERDDGKPGTTEQSRALGRQLLDRAVAAIGGAERLDALVSYRETLSRTVESDGRSYRVTETVVFLLPDAVFSETCWDDGCWSHVVTASGAWSTQRAAGAGAGAGGSEDLVAEQRTAVLRSAGRHPLTLLRARDRGGLVATSSGEQRSIDTAGEGVIELDLFTLHLDGATTTLGLDALGRIRLLGYRGRGPTFALGRIERIYSGFHEVAGLTLPGRVDVLFEGKPVPDTSGSFTVQAANDPADRALFVRPAAPAAGP